LKTETVLKSILLLGLIGAGYFGFNYTELGQSITIETLLDWIAEHGSIAPLVYIVIYILGTVFFLPGTLLSFVGAVLFGAYLGTLYVWTGAVIGATFAFMIARALGRPFVVELLGHRVGRLEQQIRDNGFRGLLIIRLLPIFPFPSVNFASALTSIRLGDYVLATAVGIIPGAFVYQYLFAKFGRRILKDGLFRFEYLRDPELWMALGMFAAFIIVGKLLADRYQAGSAPAVSSPSSDLGPSESASGAIVSHASSDRPGD
jgi:uncharacterized membrane protein YdjX (TVP38/TMEM64 family)